MYTYWDSAASKWLEEHPNLIGNRPSNCILYSIHIAPVFWLRNSRCRKNEIILVGAIRSSTLNVQL